VTATDERSEAFADRLRGQVLSALELYSIVLGDRLGLYRALADGRPRTSSELSLEQGLAERYVREWFEQQAVAGILEVDDVAAEPSERRYRLPTRHATALLDPTDPAYSAASLRSVVALSTELPDVVEAFRTGGGLAWHEVEYGEGESRDANRATFERELAGWIACASDVHERLIDPERPASVADVGCGAGWSSLALARAYPRAALHGVDANAHSIELARRHAREAGLDERVTFAVSDAAHLDGGPYDLVCFIECLHDMPRPVDALRRARALLGEGGAVLVVDEKAAESFTVPGDELERSLYAWSVLSCLPYGMSGDDPAGTGTVMRPDTLRRYASEAGLDRFEILPVEHRDWRIYLLRPGGEIRPKR
jgi:2-polyprenyl-3-methyl-5-hydroxy-6-metoxy-1,4-benzoquinol methylase